MTAERAGAAGAMVLAMALVAGCGGSPASGDEAPSTAGTAASSSSTGTSSRATPAATKGALQVSGAYLPKPPLKDMAALYFTVRNTGARPDHLDRVTVPGLASNVTTHTNRDHSMVQVDGYRVPAHGKLVLRRGGNHIMLMHLTRMPKPGSTVHARLFFKHTGTVDLKIPVVASTYRPADGQTP